MLRNLNGRHVHIKYRGFNYNTWIFITGSQSSSLLQHDNRENNIKIQKPSNLYHEYGGKNSRNIKDRSIIKEQGFNVKSGKPSPVHGHREFSSKKNVAMNIRPVTSKQSGEKIMKEKGHTMLTSTPFNKRSAANRYILEIVFRIFFISFLNKIYIYNRIAIFWQTASTL